MCVHGVSLPMYTQMNKDAFKAISGDDAEKAAQWFIFPGLHSM